MMPSVGWLFEILSFGFEFGKKLVKVFLELFKHYVLVSA